MAPALGEDQIDPLVDPAHNKNSKFTKMLLRVATSGNGSGSWGTGADDGKSDELISTPPSFAAVYTRKRSIGGNDESAGRARKVGRFE